MPTIRGDKRSIGALGLLLPPDTAAIATEGHWVTLRTVFTTVCPPRLSLSVVDGPSLEHSARDNLLQLSVATIAPHLELDLIDGPGIAERTIGPSLNLTTCEH